MGPFLLLCILIAVHSYCCSYAGAHGLDVKSPGRKKTGASYHRKTRSSKHPTHGAHQFSCQTPEIENLTKAHTYMQYRPSTQKHRTHNNRLRVAARIASLLGVPKAEGLYDTGMCGSGPSVLPVRASQQYRRLQMAIGTVPHTNHTGESCLCQAIPSAL